MTKIIKRQAKGHYLTEFPNIFKPIQRGAREKGVQINYMYGNGALLKIKMFKQLDIADQDLFLAIISLIAEYSKGITGEKDTQNPITQELRDKLELKDMLFELPILKLETTIYKLLETIQRPDNKQTYKWCLEALERLADCSIWYNTEKYVGHSNLMSYKIDKDTKIIHIAINPISASVFLSGDKYVIHNLQERYTLKMDAAKALQSYLNRMIIPGQTKDFYIDTLCKNIYGDNENDVNLRNYRRNIKKAIKELQNKKEYKFFYGMNAIIKISRIKNILLFN